MILPLLCIPLITLIYIICFFIFDFDIEWTNSAKRVNNFYTTLKLIVLSSLGTSLAYSLYLWKKYPYVEEGLVYYPGDEVFGQDMELYHNLNLPFIILTSFILFLTVLVVWYSNINAILYSVLILVLEFCLTGAFATTNMFIFLMFFELSAIPIFILILYCGSIRKERIKASYYFILFTLYGSISLLLLLISIFGAFFQTPLNQESVTTSLWVLLFIAFAVKMPLFPLHIWLPQAHVEASTATSILLAALMLKLGGYGMIKYLLPLFTAQVQLYFKPIALFISILGVIFGSLVAIRQLDLKRQIAFSSVAHMSFASVGIFTFTNIGVKGAVYLMISHGLTSAALFFLVGLLSERFHTRSIMHFGGLLGTMPLFSIFFIFINLANIGFPGTSGFLPEFFILVAVVSDSMQYLFFVLLGMFFTTAATLLTMLRVLFGHLKIAYTSSSWPDLAKLDFYILSIISIAIIHIGLVDFLVEPNMTWSNFLTNYFKPNPNFNLKKGLVTQLAEYRIDNPGVESSSLSKPIFITGILGL